MTHTKHHRAPSCTQAAVPSGISFRITFTFSFPLSSVCYAGMHPHAYLPTLVICDFSTIQDILAAFGGFGNARSESSSQPCRLTAGLPKTCLTVLPTPLRIHFFTPRTFLITMFLIPIRISFSKLQQNSFKVHLMIYFG